MAGDWIKMRDELYTHPKFLRMARTLVYGENPGLLLYVCGSDSLGIDVFPPSNVSVTERALRLVTEEALRDVTMSALLRVWCSVNSHCKVPDLSSGNAVCDGMDLLDIDTIAKFSGFGDAMDDAGWVRLDEASNCLVFPNFLEFNEPACLRKKPLTTKERVARYRARKNSQEHDIKDSVTDVTKCNAREEKRRVEKKKGESPLPPFPANLDTNSFRSAWAEWLQYRKERKPKVTPTGAKRTLAMLSEWGPERACAAIHYTIAKGWQGIVEPDRRGNGKPTAAERQVSEIEKFLGGCDHDAD
jgi:hypothetical protein